VSGAVWTGGSRDRSPTFQNRERFGGGGDGLIAWDGETAYPWQPEDDCEGGVGRDDYPVGSVAIPMAARGGGERFELHWAPWELTPLWLIRLGNLAARGNSRRHARGRRSRGHRGRKLLTPSKRR
jgi:hypothetical protein